VWNTGVEREKERERERERGFVIYTAIKRKL
jgi:hypothetical protein